MIITNKKQRDKKREHYCQTKNKIKEMKKLFMMAVMAAVATTSFAQDDLVKQAEKLSAKGQHAEAIKMITPSLTS